MDLKAMPVRSYYGYSYFIIFFDDNTSHGWTVNLKNKSNADPAIRQFIAKIRTQYSKQIREFQINAGGEFKSWELTEFLREFSVKILTSIPHMHQQNGHAERFIRTIMEKAQTIRLESCLLQSWWEFSVDCAIHIYNCTPIKQQNWMSPFEKLEHTKPDVTHFRVFGCGAYVFLPEEVHTNKLNPKSELMTFIGYPQGTNRWMFMRGPNNVIFTAAQALFDETLFLKCPDMHWLGYTPVADPPVGQQGEYNIPLDDENEEFGGDRMAVIYCLFHHHEELTSCIITCHWQVLWCHQALEDLKILVCHHWLCHMVINQKLLQFQENWPLLCHRSNLSYLTMMRTITV